MYTIIMTIFKTIQLHWLLWMSYLESKDNLNRRPFSHETHPGTTYKQVIHGP